MAYAQTNFPEINPDKVSLIVAFSNLLARLGTEIEPTQLNLILTQDDPVIDWWTLQTYIDGLTLSEKSDEGWPPTSNAIVRFTRMDIASAGPVDHYCLVADHRIHSIIDSLDGTIKSAATYGYPQGWASYALKGVEEDLEDPIGEIVKNPHRIYTVLRGGESGWEIARKLKIPADELKEHNDLDNFDVIPAGTELHLPVILETEQPRDITYKILEQPLEMHVEKEGGIRKWSFGNAKTFKDITPNGPNYPDGTNVTVVAVAEVPLTDDDQPVVAAYYLDRLALGNFAQTGRVQYTIGFNHSHLKEGFVDAPVVNPKPEVQAQLEAAEKALEAADEGLEAIEEMPDEEPAPITWKSTYTSFNEDGEPLIYVANEALAVHDYDGDKPDRMLARGKGVKIAGTFWKDDVEIGRPYGVTSWYGIEMSKLALEDDPALYNYDVPLVERAHVPSGGGHLTPVERYWYIPFAKSVSQYARLTDYFKNKNKE